MGYRYYYSVLPKEQKQIYEDLRRGITAMEPSVRVPRTDGRTLSDILFCLRLDEPCLAFVKGTSVRIARDADHMEVLPQYAFEPAKMRTFQQTIRTRVQKITAPMREKNEEERLLAVHDWLVDSVRYDKLFKNYAHEVLGPLCHGVGVCEGIAKTAKILLDELDIESLVVIGREDEEKHGVEGMRHAWNIVRVGGRTYHMDVTFDIGLPRCGLKRYDYYKLSDEEIYRDHRSPVWSVPACPQSDGYYKKQRLTADSPEALEKLLTRLTKKKGAVHVFQWTSPDGSFPMEEILRICGGIARAKGKIPALSFNRSQRVALFTLAENHEL